MSELLEIGERLKEAMVDRYGESQVAERFQAFDTICSATQDRQDAVVALLRDKPEDVMIVIGGYNRAAPAIWRASARRRARPFTSPIPIVSCQPARFVIVRSARRRK